LTISHLYALYRHAYDEFDLLPFGTISLRSGLPLVARAVAELAESDARDGKPLRSLDEFQQALAQGAAALVPLGWIAA